MSVPEDKAGRGLAQALEARHDTVIPSKVGGFGTVAIKIDVAGFDDPKLTLVVEAWAGKDRIAYMECQGGPRAQTTIAGERIPAPDTLVFETGSNREHKDAITVTTTVRGSDVAKQPIEVATR